MVFRERLIDLTATEDDDASSASINCSSLASLSLSDEQSTNASPFFNTVLSTSLKRFYSVVIIICL